MQKIDTHQHLLYPEKFNYAWAAAIPALQKPFRLEAYWQAAQECSVAGALFMEVDVDRDQSARECAFFCEMAEDPQNRIRGVIAAGRPEEEGFMSYLDTIQHPKLKGIRRVLHTQPDALLESVTLREHLQALGHRALPFDVCVQPHQLKAATRLMAACPDTQFILDHCGNPPWPVPERAVWETDLRAVSELPNVACKVSGLVVRLPEEALTAEALRAWIESVIDAFGWDRLLWGGDWPVCNLSSSLREWVFLLDAVLSGEDERNLAKLYQHNAERIYAL